MRLRLLLRLRALGFQRQYVGLANSRTQRRWGHCAAARDVLRGVSRLVCGASLRFLRVGAARRLQSPLALDVRGGHAAPLRPLFAYGHRRRTLRWGFDSRLRDFKRGRAMPTGVPYGRRSTAPAVLGLAAAGTLKFQAHVWVRYLWRAGQYLRQ